MGVSIYFNAKKSVCLENEYTSLGNIIVVPRFFRDDEMILQSFICILTTRQELKSHPTLE